jgi:hypothetical protein
LRPVIAGSRPVSLEQGHEASQVSNKAPPRQFATQFSLRSTNALISIPFFVQETEHRWGFGMDANVPKTRVSSKGKSRNLESRKREEKQKFRKQKAEIKQREAERVRKSRNRTEQKGKRPEKQKLGKQP